MKKRLTLSLSQKRSYAAALGHPNGSRRIGEVNGQPKKKSSVATVGPAKRRKLVEVYHQDLLYPTGIVNVANINKKLKNIKSVRRCRDGMPKSMQTR